MSALLNALMAAAATVQVAARTTAGQAATPQPPPSLAVLPRLASTVGPLRPDPGSWAEYLVRTRGDQDVRIRICVVPPGVERGRVWLEVAVLGSESLPFAARLLVVARTGKVERAVVYALGQASLEIPIAGDAGAIATPPDPPSTRVVQESVEDVTVAAGSFRATKLRISASREGMRLWKSDAVPLWGLVRAHDGRRTVELLRYGESDARSVLPSVYGNGNDSANE